MQYNTKVISLSQRRTQPVTAWMSLSVETVTVSTTALPVTVKPTAKTSLMRSSPTAVSVTLLLYSLVCSFNKHFLTWQCNA